MCMYKLLTPWYMPHSAQRCVHWVIQIKNSEHAQRYSKHKQSPQAIAATFWRLLQLPANLPPAVIAKSWRSPKRKRHRFRALCVTCETSMIAHSTTNPNAAAKAIVVYKWRKWSWNEFIFLVCELLQLMYSLSVIIFLATVSLQCDVSCQANAETSASGAAHQWKV